MILSERAMAFTDYTSSGDATASPPFYSFEMDGLERESLVRCNIRN